MKYLIGGFGQKIKPNDTLVFKKLEFPQLQSLLK
jgi:hypothetical protein